MKTKKRIKKLESDISALIENVIDLQQAVASLISRHSEPVPKSDNSGWKVFNPDIPNPPTTSA